MPASITLSSITWSTPDGRLLLDSLNLSFGPERTGLIGRNGVGKTTLFNIIAGSITPLAGTVSVSGSIGLLRQDILAGQFQQKRKSEETREAETIADLFGARAALALLAEAEAGRAGPEQLAEADWTIEERMAGALQRLGLAAPFDTPLAALSGGQRTRAALAALVFSQPDFLLLDEPTNNLDAEGRRLVTGLLAGWRGGAIVISHDRALLEEMDAIVELTSLGAARHGGNWSHYQARKALELEAAEHGLETAERQAAEVARTAQKAAERQARRDSAGRRKRAKGDAPRIFLDAQKERSEATRGSNARLAASRQAQAAAALEEARGRVEILQPLSMQLPSTGLPPGREVLRVERLSAGHAPGAPVIRDFSLSVTGPERIAIMGANGAGKTTLLSAMTGRLAPLGGTVRRPVSFAFIDQSVSLLDPGATVRENFRRLNPASDENGARAALARFLFRADAALQTVATLSGGQRLRAGLACTLGRPDPPQLLFLDEPTNHLDLDAIAALEAALRAYDGALVVVSHDRAFLEAVGIGRFVEI